MTALEEKAINMYAVYSTPQAVYKSLASEFGENSLSYSQVLKIRERFRKQILDRRNELTSKIPILDANERFGYLQQILDGALEGEIVYDKRSGVPVEAKIDRNTALNALKLAYEQTQQKGVVMPDADEDMIRSIVQSAFEDMRTKNPTMSIAEITEKMITELPDAKQYIEELNVH